MFEHLREYRRIVVTGPHRSGTTIAMEMIAHDTGHKPIREERFGFRDIGRFREVMRRANDVVIQAPGMFWELKPHDTKETLFVLMRRPLREIHGSRSFLKGSGRPLVNGRGPGDRAEDKYLAWDTLGLTNRMEIDYHDLARHPLWVSPEQRRSLGTAWHHRRTAL